MKKIIQTAIVGYGLSGRYFHAPFLKTHPGFNVRKVVERNGEFAKELFPRAEIVRNFEEIITDREIELVVISTPNNLHFPMAEDCLLNGKHVVIEKPFTLTTEEADELITLSGRKRRKIFVYQNRRWDGDFLTIQKLLKSGTLGELTWYEAHFDRYRPKLTTRLWRDDINKGGGVLYDLGPHLIDQALKLFGTPDRIMAEISIQRKGSKVDDFFKITLSYRKLKVLLTAGMMVKDPGPRYILHGNIGSYIKYGIDPQEEELRKGMLPNSKNWGTESPDHWGLITFDYADMNIHGEVETESGNYGNFYKNVYDVLAHKAIMEIKPSEARNVIRIIELARESAERNKEIKVKL